ncbi:hypothetical protein [Tepidanaerobacter acetatoxydans]|uniref:hypothetical protein n=1 Tax=Tepidanaerobacter acetatoxydans TaxID=499229 RepID=UPI001BD55460|nr:hypothetical protein [Tepidanaerobacter acetatoxydans]
MSMAEKEIAAGNDEQRSNETHEPKIFESGYFYLSQQINDLRDRMDAKFDRVDAKFEANRKETDAKFEAVYKEIKDLSDKTDARFDKVDERFDKVDERFEKIEDKFDALNKWAVGSVIAVLIGTISVIVTLLLK